MELTYFLIKQLPLVNDIINDLNKLMMNIGYEFTINENFNHGYNNGLYIEQMGLINNRVYAKIFVRNSLISSIMIYSFDCAGRVDYKKSLIHPKFLEIKADIIKYQGKNYISQLVKNIDLNKGGYYETSLPIYITYKVI